MTFLPAWDKTTGKKLDAPVPEHWFDHPVLGENLSRIEPVQSSVQPTPADPVETDKKLDEEVGHEDAG